MKQTVTLSDFHRQFQAIRPDNFSYEGRAAIFAELEAYEDSTGEELEFDVIAICCDYAEEHWLRVAEDYNLSSCGTPEELIDKLRDESGFAELLSDGESIVYRQF